MSLPFDYEGKDHKLLRASQQTAFSDIEREHRAEFDRMKVWSSKVFPYISLGEYSFLEYVAPLLKPHMRVVDVGCGAGDKLARFHALDPTLRITGIELDPVMAKCARYMCPYAEIIEGDAIAQDYSKFDLIYMYWPISYSPRQCDLQWLCVQTMKKGAILFVACAQRNISDYPNMPDLNKGWKKPRNWKG